MYAIASIIMLVNTNSTAAKKQNPIKITLAANAPGDPNDTFPPTR